MDSFEAELKGKGYRLTSQRLSVLKAAADMPGHFTAEELHRTLNRSDIGIATVYRTVQLLQEMGYLKQAHIPGDSAVYEYAHEGGHSHAHMQCSLCGTVLELHEDMMADMEKAVLEKYGFEVADHHITLTGLCIKCRSENTIEPENNL
jgi:Fur family transcriptional regulator, ferric uptake regulator